MTGADFCCKCRFSRRIRIAERFKANSTHNSIACTASTRGKFMKLRSHRRNRYPIPSCSAKENSSILSWLFRVDVRNLCHAIIERDCQDPRSRQATPFHDQKSQFCVTQLPSLPNQKRSAPTNRASTSLAKS